MPATPRVFIVRHGETEWSLNGRHTSRTELSLTADGEKRVRATGRALVGEDRLIVPASLAHMLVFASIFPHFPLCVFPLHLEIWTVPRADEACKPRYVSPRSRARRTLELLDLGCREPYPWQQQQQHSGGGGEEGGVRTEAKTEVLEAIREWDYGLYEGLTSTQIRALRSKQGKDGVWDIWRDGCEGGE
ncbi:MAG: hypothetical protein Q9167_004391 [Letrouitia subvulpina]